MSEITRVEIIDETGRVFSRRNLNVELQIQDKGKTLKVFIEHNPNDKFDGSFDTQSIIDITMTDYASELLGYK